MGTRGKWAFGGKEYPKCPKGVSEAPWAHYPKMFTNGQQGKWELGANGHLGERGTPSALKGHPKCLMPISPKCLQMSIGVNEHLGANVHLGERGTQVP